MAALMFLPLLIALLMHENTTTAYLITIAVYAVPGFLMCIKKPIHSTIYAREGLVIVALSWIVISLIGALPFFLSGEIPLYHDALFEIVSGLTTTGASILTNVEALSYSSLMWRAFSHWIGGMGVLVLVLAILPQSETHSMHLLRAEIPGIKVGKIVSKIRMTASILYGIYLAMTIAEILLLKVGGMTWFDAIAHSFSTAGTGGFSIKNTSIGYYDSSFLQNTITVFMFLFSLNFNLYYMILIGQIGQIFKNEELRWFLITVASSIVLISINIYPIYGNIGTTLKNAAFQVVSIVSTTGFSTVNYDLWPEFSKIIIICLSFIGACAGSTCGGIKFARIIILIKSGICELKSMIFPHSVNLVKLERKKVETGVLSSTHAFFVIYILIIAVSILILSLEPFDLITDATAAISCISNTGIGLANVGPTGNYSDFSILSKLVLIFDMLAGRLELFPMLILFSRSIWKK